MSLPVELFLAFTLVEEVYDEGWPDGECPTCGVAGDHTTEDCMKNLHREDSPPDEPGCCSVLQPCGDEQRSSSEDSG